MYYCRPMTEPEVQMVVDWWRGWNNANLDRDDLSLHGFLGVRNDLHVPCGACFLYLTSNSKVAQIGYPVSSPDERLTSRDRMMGLDAAIAGAKKAALDLGYKRIISLSSKSGLTGIYKRQGFVDLPVHDFLVYGVTDP